MLEHYGFPWGNKRKLQWALALSNKALRSERRMLRNLEREHYRLIEELHEVHIAKLQPLADKAADSAKISVSVEDGILNIEPEVIGARMMIPHFSIRRDSAMDYTKRAVNYCARELAQRLVERISWELRKVYEKLNDGKGGF